MNTNHDALREAATRALGCLKIHDDCGLTGALRNETRLAMAELQSALSQPMPEAAAQGAQPCGGRDYCSRFPFCGCGDQNPLPERDATKPAEKQGLFRKFDVRRVDGSDGPGGKHEGCEYFVLDIVHDNHAKAALVAYAASVEVTHPKLAADMRDRYSLLSASPAAPEVAKSLPTMVDKKSTNPQPQAQPTPSADDIHSCGEFCDRPECVAAREAQAQGELDEREAFESHWYNFYHSGSIVARQDGSYIGRNVQNAWEAWQARAQSHRKALAQHRAALEECQQDAARFRWLTEDHSDAAARQKRNEILERMPVMSRSAASADIDAAITRANQVLEGGGK